MKYIFVTLFPNLIKPYFEDSILKRAIEKELIEIEFFDPREYSLNKHNKVDDYLCGGGAGLLMTPQPLYDCLSEIREKYKNAHFIFPTPAGKVFKQNDSKRLAKREIIVFVCGRYEGIDERILEEFCDEVFSIGDYILTGGELSSLVMADSISRNIRDVLGNADSILEESFENILLEAPSFTKPNIFKKNSVISELLKGNHSKISTLKNKLAILKTKYYRNDLFEKFKARKNYEK